MVTKVLGTCIAFVVLAVSGGEGCSCLYRPRQAKYCSAEFSAKVKPLVTFDIPSGPFQDRYYFVEVIHTYKTTTSLGNYMFLRTATSSAACGVTLTLNSVYIVNGDIETGTVLGTTMGSINSCGWNEPWSIAQLHINTAAIGSWPCPYLYVQVANNVLSADRGEE